MAPCPTVCVDRWVTSDAGFSLAAQRNVNLGTCVLIRNRREDFYVRIMAMKGETIFGLVKSSLMFPNKYNIGDLVKFKWEHVLRIHPASNLKEKKQYALRVLRSHGFKSQDQIKSFIAAMPRKTIRVVTVDAGTDV